MGPWKYCLYKYILGIYHKTWKQTDHEPIYIYTKPRFNAGDWKNVSRVNITCYGTMVIRAVVREKVWIFQCSEKLFSYIVAYLIELGQLNTYRTCKQ